MDTSTLSKSNLTVGQEYRFKPSSGKQLFVNDDYQYGLYVQKFLDTCTKLVGTGKVISGKMDTDFPVKILNLCDRSPYIDADTILIETKRTDGCFVGLPLKAFITLDLFFECFERL